MIDIIPASASDQDRVFKYLVDHLYPDEPLASSVGRVPDSIQNCPAVHFLQQNLSFLAVDKDNPDEICGVVLNHTEDLNSSSEIWDHVDEQQKKEDTPYGKVMRFLVHSKQQFLTKLAQHWPEAKDEKSLDICILSVRRASRRQGLANQLLERSVQLAREKNYKFSTIECSSAHSAVIAESHGFTRIHEILYSNYKNVEGEVVFKTSPPHFAFVAYAKKL